MMAVQGDPCQSDSAAADVSAEQCPDNPDLEEPSDWTSGQVMLPPCIVCGDKASGWHYGANTCEPCKVSSPRDCNVAVEILNSLKFVE